MIKVQDHIVKPTIFPDGTSQVWKLPEELVNNPPEEWEIVWEFENESEVFHVCQLCDLLNQITNEWVPIVLHCPFMPYGRQDKEISNDTTFALTSLINILEEKLDMITTIDLHGKQTYPLKSLCPMKYIRKTIDDVSADIICFPDTGASDRYSHHIDLPYFCFEKTRDQKTGQIIGLKFLDHIPVVRDLNILIVDDICDGGRTFIECAKILRDYQPLSISLYTTHGIYSKGIEPIKESGINRIFNYKREIK